MKLTLHHADTCLPDYWGGHHRAHISVPVFNGMTLDELKVQLKSELNQGAIAGSDELSGQLGDGPDSCEKAGAAAVAAVEALAQTEPGTPLFKDLEPVDEDDDSHLVYAYFVFVEDDEEEG